MTSISIFKSKLEAFLGSPVVKTALSPQGVRVPSLARELRSRMLSGVAKHKQKQKYIHAMASLKKKKSKLFVEAQYDTEAELEEILECWQQVVCNNLKAIKN